MLLLFEFKVVMIGCVVFVVVRCCCCLCLLWLLLMWLFRVVDAVAVVCARCC